MKTAILKKALNFLIRKFSRFKKSKKFNLSDITFDYKQFNSYVNKSNKKTVFYDLFFTQGGYHGGGEWGKAVLLDIFSVLKNDNSIHIVLAIDTSLSIDSEVLAAININKKKVNIINLNSFEKIKKIVNSDIFDVFFTPAIVVYTENYRYLSEIGGKLNFKVSKTKIIAPLLDIRDLELSLLFENNFKFRQEIGCKSETKVNDYEYNKLLNSNKIKISGYINMFRGIIEDKSVHKVITISEYCKNKMIECLEIDSEKTRKINVLYPKMKSRAKPNQIGNSLVGMDISTMQYILAINLYRQEKNGSAIAVALDQLVSEKKVDDSIYFVLTGLQSLEQLDVNIKNSNRFIFLDFISPENLEYLYQNAKCLLYPSLHEGFGAPPLEAMTYCVPSLVANNTALPEVYGNSVVYCDPLDLKSIKNGIMKCLQQPPSREIMISRYESITKRQNRDSQKLVKMILDNDTID